MSNSLTLTLKDIDPSTANAIRRTILADVPTLAVEDVRISENSSSLYDETIAHRLGLIPIKTDLKLFNFKDKCKCKGKGCPSCTLTLTLDVKCKKNFLTVYSHDLKSSDSKLKPVEGIPIVRLGNGQKITLSAEAVLGTAKEHAKWQPAVAGYKYYPIIKISKKCTKCKECVDACPVNILKYAKGKITVTDKKVCTLCNSCVEACEEGAITVAGDDTKFIFKIESQGAIPPKDLFKIACETLEGKAKELSKLL
jgi:DNA-directed RNA polymerase subunit D